MKKLSAFMMSVFIGTRLFAVDSVRFTEKLADKIVTTRDCFEGDCSTTSEQITTISATFSASILVPGLAAATIDESTELSLSLGGFSFSASAGESDAGSSNSGTFYQFIDGEDANGNPTHRRVGQITFSRSGDRLSVTASSSDLDGASFVAQDQAGGTGPFSGQTELTIGVGEFEITRNVYFKGTSSVTHRIVGSGDDAEEFDLNSVAVAGEADTAIPTVLITMPKANQRWSNEVFTVRGKAADNYGVGRVLLMVNDEEFDAQFENENWEQEITLTPGTNIIKAQSFDLERNQSAIATVKMVYVLTDNLELTVDAGGKVTGVVDQQLLELGKGYKATAMASNAFLFAGWSGDIISTNPALNFLMVTNLSLHAQFVPNPFIPIKGVYNGLFFPGNSNASRSAITTELVSSNNSGYFTLTLTDKGLISSGKLILGGKPIPFSRAQFDLEGHAHFTITRAAGLPSLIVDLQLDFQNGTQTIIGTVQANDNSFTADLLGDLAIGNATFLAKHTFVIPGNPADDTNTPAGDGAGTINVNNKGIVTLAGSLGDGTAIPQSTSLSRNGDWPLYVPLQGGRGLLIGWANFTTNPQPYHILGDHVRWIKAPAILATDKFYRAGFNQDKMLQGAKYIAPLRGTNVIEWTNGVVLIDGGNLTASISNQATVASNKVSILSNSNSIVATLAPGTGLITGSFKHASFGTAAKTFKGALIQRPLDFDGAFIGGWFLGTNQSGYVDLRRTPPDL